MIVYNDCLQWLFFLVYSVAYGSCLSGCCVRNWSIPGWHEYTGSSGPALRCNSASSLCTVVPSWWESDIFTHESLFLNNQNTMAGKKTRSGCEKTNAFYGAYTASREPRTKFNSSPLGTVTPHYPMVWRKKRRMRLFLKIYGSKKVRVCRGDIITTDSHNHFDNKHGMSNAREHSWVVLGKCRVFEPVDWRTVQLCDASGRPVVFLCTFRQEKKCHQSAWLFFVEVSSYFRTQLVCLILPDRTICHRYFTSRVLSMTTNGSAREKKKDRSSPWLTRCRKPPLLRNDFGMHCVSFRAACMFFVASAENLLVFVWAAVGREKTKCAGWRDKSRAENRQRPLSKKYFWANWLVDWVICTLEDFLTDQTIPFGRIVSFSSQWPENFQEPIKNSDKIKLAFWRFKMFQEKNLRIHLLHRSDPSWIIREKSKIRIYASKLSSSITCMHRTVQSLIKILFDHLKRVHKKQGKRPMTAYCFTQCSNGSSLGSLLFLRQDDHGQRYSVE